MTYANLKKRLSDLEAFGRDWHGGRTKFSSPDTLRLLISAHRIGYSDALSDAYAVTTDEESKQNEAISGENKNPKPTITGEGAGVQSEAES